MRDSKLIGSLAGLVILGSVAGASLALTGGWGPKLDPRPHEAAGWGMAQQALRLLKPGGTILVITRDTSVFKNPATDLQLASFKKAIQTAHATLEPLRVFQVDPLRPVGVPPGDFLEIIRKTPPASVVVSFMGPPVLTENQRSRLTDAKPAVVAFCPGNLPEKLDLPTLLGTGLLQAAVISRRVGAPSGSAPAGMQAWFDRYFQVVTPNDASTPSGAAKPSSSASSP